VRGDPLTRRVRHWSRWQRGRAEWTWRHEAHVDFVGQARAAWLCSWQRSGSTWVAEVLCASRGTRLIYEPANLPGRLFDGESAARTELPSIPGAELEAVERALRGRVRGHWVDQLCSSHVVRRRLVKDVRGVGLLGLVAARQPDVPIVMLVRHPLAIASSAVALGWTDQPDAPVADQLLAEVRRWSSAHAGALADAASDRALVVAYEHAVHDPAATFERILAHLRAHHRTWNSVRPDPVRLEAPSATSFRRTGSRSASEWIGSFDGIDPGVVADATALVVEAGLGGLYGDVPDVLVEPDRLRSALHAR